MKNFFEKKEMPAVKRAYVSGTGLPVPHDDYE